MTMKGEKKDHRVKVTLIMAMTLDGKIAKNSHHLTDWTSKEDKAHFLSLTKGAGAVIMGKNTFDTIKKPFRGRLTIVLTKEKRKSLPGILEFKNIPLRFLCDDLQKRGYSKVALIGGALLNGAFLKAGLINDIILTLEPRLFGEGISLFSGVECDIPLALLSIKKLNPNVVSLHYKVNY